MELGKAALRRNGMNSLQTALHPDHGLLWTDGKGIYLAPVHLYRDQLENVGSTRLGEFEFVQSVHWCGCLEDECCYMAAVHQKVVTVWRVSGAVPHLAFKQVRKINVQPIPQGCLWNPSNDVLCLLSRQQCSFYFRHQNNRGSFAFSSLEHEKISCGCWSPDGTRLVICAGAALLVYTWPNLEANINDFVTAAWRIPGVSGTVTAIVPGSNGHVVCASDLPLETLCKNNSTDVFLMPDIGRKATESSDILRPNESVSLKDSLLNLQPNQKQSLQVEDSAMLTVVALKPGTQDPTVVTSTRVPGLLSPDLLHFQVDSQCIVVGSNTQNVLQVFALLDNHLLSAGHVTVDKDERPKGVCSLQTAQQSSADGVLVLIGATAQSDSVFPSANNSASYTLRLKFFPVRPEKSRQLPNGHAVVAKAPSSSLTKSESVREARTTHLRDAFRATRQASYKGERPDHRFRSPDRGMSSESRIKLSLADIHAGAAHPRLVEEITDSPRSIAEEEEVDGEKEIGSPEEERPTVERVEFSEVAPQFHNSKLTQQYDVSPVTTNDRTVITSADSVLSSDHAKTLEAVKTASVQAAASDRTTCCTASESSSGQSTSNKRAETSVFPESHSKQLSNCAAASSSGQSAANERTQSSFSPPPEQLPTNFPAISIRVDPPVENGSAGDSEWPAVQSAVDVGGQEPLVESSSARRRDPRTAVQSEVGRERRSAMIQQSGASWRQERAASPQPACAASAKSRRQRAEDESSVCSSVGSNYETLERQIQAQNDQIATLQKKVENLTALIEGTGCVFPSKYQEMNEPETISIQCVVGGARVTRKFLLDCGRLQLDSVKQAFGLSSVELILEGEALVLGANVDGYIPMKFTADSFLQVTGIPMMYSPQLTHKARHNEAAKS